MPTNLIATWHLITAWISERLGSPDHDERGNITLEHVLWAAAIVVLVALAVAALTTYIQGQLAKLPS